MSPRRRGQTAVHAWVLTLVPKVLGEPAPLFSRSLKKSVKNDCKAAVD
jgi:hypothetical protein